MDNTARARVLDALAYLALAHFDDIQQRTDLSADQLLAILRALLAGGELTTDEADP